MLKIPGAPPVRTRIPLAAWAVAAIVTLFSLMSSLLHTHTSSDHALPSAEQGAQPKAGSHQAKV
jgi:hypothetical protein